MNPFSQPSNDIKKIQLEADIRLLEKKKGELLEEIERLQSSKAKTLQFLHEDTEKQQKRHESLTGEVAGMSSQVNKLGFAISEIKLGVDEEVEIKRKEADEYYDQKIKQADAKLQSAMAEIERVRTMQKQLEDREDEMDRLAEDVVRQGKENEEDRKRLIRDREFFEEGKEESEKELAKNRSEIRDLKRKIETETEALEILQFDIKGSKGRLKEINDTIEERENELKLREADVTSKETFVTEKEKELQQKEIWLNDREQTVGRAYQEVISKGGTVNG